MTGCVHLNLPLLLQLSAAAELEHEAMVARGESQRLPCGEALQLELYRQRRALLDAAVRVEAPVIDAMRPFARVAQLVDRDAGGVLLSLRLAGKRADFVQLTGPHFHAAADLVGDWDRRIRR
ncbi:MAG: hypothetical protein ACXU82_03685 [Caulobacteraceae bacterium]